MLTFLAFVIAIIALVRVGRLERELRLLRSRLDSRDRESPLPEREAPSVPPLVPAPAGPPSTAGEPPFQAPPIPTPAFASAPSIHDGNPEALKRRIGERLLLYAGMIVLVLGVTFFLRYAFEREWMSPSVRVLIGLTGGLSLAVGGRWLARAGFRPYGLFLIGGGLAVLFLSIYSAFAFYALIGPAAAFAALGAVAVAAAVLADRESALPLAMMAVAGGFATPFLVGRGGDAQIVLFSYDAVLIGATMYLAHRRGWPSLNLVSFVFTFFTVVAWADAYYTSAKYLRTELFLTLYCAMFVAMLRETLRSRDPWARLVAAILCAAPVLYHGASIAILFDHDASLLVYLLLMSVAVVVASVETSLPAVRLAGWVAIIAPLMYFVAVYREQGWRSSAIVTSLGIWIVFLANHIRLLRRGDRLGGFDVALVHASGVGAFAAMYVGLAGAETPGLLAAIAALLAAADAGIWYMLRRHSAAIHWLGLAFTLIASAIAVGFEGHWVVVMWAAEGAVLVGIGVRHDREAFRVAGLAVFALAAWTWIEAPSPPSSEPFVVLLHARALAGLCLIGLLYAGGWLMRVPRAAANARWPIERAAMLVGASACTVALISLEIVSYWAHRGRTVDANLARQLMLSASWAAYAGVLVTVGMRRHYPPIRYFAIVLFAVTLLKVFAVDLQQLEGIYRVIAFITIGGILLLVSFLYQRSR